MSKQVSHLGLIILFWVVSLIIGYMLYVAIRLIAFDLPYLIENWEAFANVRSEAVLFLIILNFALSAYFLFPLWSFRKFLKNLKESQTFAERNISLLEKFSVGLFVFILARILIEVYWRFFTNMTDTYGNEVPVQYSSYVALFLFALSIRVIIHLLSSGVRLKQENDLTI